MKKIHLLLIEDNRLLREVTVAMFKRHADIKIVAAPGDRNNIAVGIRGSQPGMVLLGLGLRTQNSLELVRFIRKGFPGTKIIVMDFVPSHADVVVFVQAGVSGFILKDATTDDIVGTIRTVAAGGSVLPPSLIAPLFSRMFDKAIDEPSKSSTILIESPVRLTRRERQAMELIADGLNNKEIAHKLHLSTYTVKYHVHRILEKLALRTRLQIAKYART